MVRHCPWVPEICAEMLTVCVAPLPCTLVAICRRTARNALPVFARRRTRMDRRADVVRTRTAAGATMGAWMRTARPVRAGCQTPRICAVPVRLRLVAQPLADMAAHLVSFRALLCHCVRGADDLAVPSPLLELGDLQEFGLPGHSAGNSKRISDGSGMVLPRGIDDPMAEFAHLTGGTLQRCAA